MLKENKIRKTGILRWGMTCLLSAAMCMNPVVYAETETEAVVEMEAAEEDWLEIPGIGMKCLLTEEMKNAGIRVGYQNYSALQELGLLNIRINEADLYYVLVYPKEEYQSESEEDHWTTRFLQNYPEMDYKEDVNGEYHYTYMGIGKSLEWDSYSVEELEKIEAALSLCDELIESIEYLDLEISPLTFDSVNLDGKQVTDAIFQEKKMTVLNIWATYCNPCINEMPELAEWEKELPEDVQILYLCTDITSEDSENIQLAEMIVEKSGINRKNVIFNLPGTCTDLLMSVTGVPTTVFVDQNGTMMEDYQIGASVESYKNILAKYLEEGADE